MKDKLYPAPAVRRYLWLLLAATTSVFLMAAGGTQCTRTSDTVFTPQVSSADGDHTVGYCWRDCAQDAHQERINEMDRFVEAIQNCQDGTDCRAREAALHVSIMQGITQTMRECMSGCHSQGHGSGGQ